MITVQLDRAHELVTVVGPDGALTDCARFLERLRVRGLSFATIEAYAYDLALVHRWLAETGHEHAEVDSEDVHQFIAWERGRQSHPKSINRRMHTWRLYFRFVFGHELPGGSEKRGRYRQARDREMGLQRLRQRSERQLRVKEPRTLVEPLSVTQVRDLLQSFRCYRDLAIAYLMLLCGLRSGEVRGLRVPSIDFCDRRVRVRGKGDKERMMPLPRLLVDIIQRYLSLERPQSSDDHLFLVRRGAHRGQPMTAAALRRIFRSRREANSALANANPHRLRHTFGTDMARNGVRLPTLQRMMGHAHPETTLQYVNLSAADISAEFERAVAALEKRYDNDGTVEQGS
jgi:site-specific recombinase XerD